MSCPTIQFHTQFVAAASDAPLARNASGMISGVHAHGMGPHEYPNAALKSTTHTTTSAGV